MSRQNKVNPGQYTQRGRLAQDDVARELMRQRASMASRNLGQPEGNGLPWPSRKVAANQEEPADREEETIRERKAPAKTTARPAMKAKAKATSPKKRAAKSAKPSAKAKTGRTARKAVLARSAVKGAMLAGGRKKTRSVKPKTRSAKSAARSR